MVLHMARDLKERAAGSPRALRSQLLPPNQAPHLKQRRRRPHRQPKYRQRSPSAHLPRRGRPRGAERAPQEGRAEEDRIQPGASLRPQRVNHMLIRDQRALDRKNPTPRHPPRARPSKSTARRWPTRAPSKQPRARSRGAARSYRQSARRPAPPGCLQNPPRPNNPATSAPSPKGGCSNRNANMVQKEVNAANSSAWVNAASRTTRQTHATDAPAIPSGRHS